MSVCSNCDDWRWQAIRMEREAECLRKEIMNLNNTNSKLERRVRELTPYEESAKRAYDKWVLDPERAS